LRALHFDAFDQQEAKNRALRSERLRSHGEHYELQVCFFPLEVEKEAAGKIGRRVFSQDIKTEAGKIRNDAICVEN